MSTFDELNAMFPNHTHFYEVQGLTMADALERCARLTGDDGEVLNHNGRIIFAVKHDIGQGAKDIQWLNAVDGTPVDVDPQ